MGELPVLSPHDRNKIYVGSQHVHRTTDGGQSWAVISPDLTLNDKSRQQFSGGLTGDTDRSGGDTAKRVEQSPIRKPENDRIALLQGTLDLLIPQGRDTELTEAGTYLRLTGLHFPLELGREYPLTLVFEKGGSVQADFDIKYDSVG